MLHLEEDEGEEHAMVTTMHAELLDTHTHRRAPRQPCRWRKPRRGEQQLPQRVGGGRGGGRDCGTEQPAYGAAAGDGVEGGCGGGKPEGDAVAQRQPAAAACRHPRQHARWDRGGTCREEGACGAHAVRMRYTCGGAHAVRVPCVCGAYVVRMRCAYGRLTRGAIRPPPRPPAHRSRPAAPRERLQVSPLRQAAPPPRPRTHAPAARRGRRRRRQPRLPRRRRGVAAGFRRRQGAARRAAAAATAGPAAARGGRSSPVARERGADGDRARVARGADAAAHLEQARSRLSSQAERGAARAAHGDARAHGRCERMPVDASGGGDVSGDEEQRAHLAPVDGGGELLVACLGGCVHFA
eukprot:scaffold93731_cov78-Phaeocystis_antarctica.AAC.9